MKQPNYKIDNTIYTLQQIKKVFGISNGELFTIKGRGLSKSFYSPYKNKFVKVTLISYANEGDCNPKRCQITSKSGKTKTFLSVQALARYLNMRDARPLSNWLHGKARSPKKFTVSFI